MPELGVSFSLEAVECQKYYSRLVRSIEVSSLKNLMCFSGDWTFHYRKENPFDFSSGHLFLSNPEKIKRSIFRKSQKIDEPALYDLLRLRPPKIVSFHLGFSTKKVRTVPPTNYFEAASKAMLKEEVFERFCQSLEIIKKSFLVSELGLPIALENLDFHDGGVYEYICQVDFINRIFAEFPDFYLLLDIAHAEITSAFFSFAPEGSLLATRKYLKLLPLSKLIEIHINAPKVENGFLQDAHLTISAVEINLLQELLNQPNLKIVNLECVNEVEKQIKILAPLIKGRDE